MITENPAIPENLIESLLMAASPYLTENELDNAKQALLDCFPVTDGMYQHYQCTYPTILPLYSTLPIHLMYFIDLAHLIYDYPQNETNTVLQNAMKSTVQLLIQFLHSFNKP